MIDKIVVIFILPSTGLYANFSMSNGCLSIIVDTVYTYTEHIIELTNMRVELRCLSILWRYAVDSKGQY